MNERDQWLVDETVKAYRGLDEGSLQVLEDQYPNDPVRQLAIAAVRAEREHAAKTIE